MVRQARQAGQADRSGRADSDDPLAQYNAKRDFSATPEPAGVVRRGQRGNAFMVQKHDATRLHWDLRLEVDGVMKSWAVTKGPSADPSVKRLAVRTEDHPLSYNTFEGTIREGEYGAGAVMVWDRGTWAPVPGKSTADLVEGHLHFRLYGERMRGEWLLVRMKGRPGEKRENWLLRKVGDDEAQAGDGLVERELTSVVSGRTMAEIAAGRDSGTGALRKTRRVRTPVRKGKRNAQLPEFRPLQLATLVDHVPAGNGWMHEIKFDGYRALVAPGGARCGSIPAAGRTGPTGSAHWSRRWPRSTCPRA